jgi:DNA replication and repair protein RecF
VTHEPTVRIARLELEQTRVYRDLALDFPPAGLRISGPNGAGKTTLLEAVELLSTTRPRRGSTDADLIRHDSGVELGVPPYARIAASVMRGDVTVRLEAFIQRAERRGTSKKLLRVADRPRRASDVVGLLPTVTFAPDDLDLIVGPPAIRRRFLDIQLSQTDRRYLRTLSRYARILAQRNGLLKQAAQTDLGAATAEQFAYWDEQLIALGAYIVAARVLALQRLGREAAARFSTLSPATGELAVAYRSTIEQNEGWWQALVNGTSDVTDAAQRVGQAYEQQLRRGRAAELARGATLVGPHRDDLAATVDGYDLARFGSRGQQRIAVLAIKLAEIATATAALELRPVLLLDDVLSELDGDHQDALIEAVCDGGGQVLISATSRALLDRPALADLGDVELCAPAAFRNG